MVPESNILSGCATLFSWRNPLSPDYIYQTLREDNSPYCDPTHLQATRYFLAKPEQLTLLEEYEEYIFKNYTTNDQNIKSRLTCTVMLAALAFEELFSTIHSQNTADSLAFANTAKNIWDRLWNNFSHQLSQDGWHHVRQNALSEQYATASSLFTTASAQPTISLFETVFSTCVNDKLMTTAFYENQQGWQPLAEVFSRLPPSKVQNTITIICYAPLIAYSVKMRLICRLLYVQNAFNSRQCEIRFVDIQTLLIMMTFLSFDPAENDDELIVSIFSQLISSKWVGAFYNAPSCDRLAISCLMIIERSRNSAPRNPQDMHDTAVFCSALIILLNKAWMQTPENETSLNATYMKNFLIDLTYRLYITWIKELRIQNIQESEHLTTLLRCIEHTNHFPISRGSMPNDNELFLFVKENQVAMFQGNRLVAGFYPLPSINMSK